MSRAAENAGPPRPATCNIVTIALWLITMPRPTDTSANSPRLRRRCPPPSAAPTLAMLSGPAALIPSDPLRQRGQLAQNRSIVGIACEHSFRQCDADLTHA